MLSVFSTPTAFFCLVSLGKWMIAPYLMHYLMTLYGSTYGKLRYLCSRRTLLYVLWNVFYETRHQVHWGLTHVVFCWHSDLISHAYKHTQTHIAQAVAIRLTNSYKYILTPPDMCSQQLSVSHWVIHWF